MYTLKDRAFKALNLKQYSKYNGVDELDYINLDVPTESQYILRMLIRRSSGTFKIPNALQWTFPLIELADKHQKNIGIVQPFVYLTIRNGIVNSVTDDHWHVDGFSTRITHLPEQNYIWSNVHPTEYVMKAINIPVDFDPLKHNIHSYFQTKITNNDILKMKEKYVYGIDPYIIHRRPPAISGIRCFIRVTFAPIEINDVNNTINELIPTSYNEDGIKNFRNFLIDYNSI